MKMPLLLLAAAATLSSCAGPRALGGADVRFVEVAALPTPDQVVDRPISQNFRIGPYDKLSVQVLGIAELSRAAILVDGNGSISLPLAGTVPAAGLTSDELAREITRRLRAAYVRDPQVSVNVEQVVSQTLAIDGQVGQPGVYPVNGRMTLIQAVATARGTSEFARLEDVIILRTVAGQRYVAAYNLGAIRRGVYADPEVFANDTIVVGDSPTRRAFRDILAVAPLLTAPLIAVLNNNN